MNGACTGGPGDGGGPGKVGVACGNTMCGAGQACCADFVLGPSCSVDSASCEGIVATCDGVEDCGGNACCEGQIGLAIACSGSPTCPGLGAEQICRDETDCTDPMVKACCYGVGLPGEPWGRCRPSCPI